MGTFSHLRTAALVLRITDPHVTHVTSVIYDVFQHDFWVFGVGLPEQLAEDGVANDPQIVQRCGSPQSSMVHPGVALRIKSRGRDQRQRGAQPSHRSLNGSLERFH